MTEIVRKPSDLERSVLICPGVLSSHLDVCVCTCNKRFWFWKTCANPSNIISVTSHPSFLFREKCLIIYKQPSHTVCLQHQISDYRSPLARSGSVQLRKGHLTVYYFIVYTFSRHFYPKRLTSTFVRRNTSDVCSTTSGKNKVSLMCLRDSHCFSSLVVDINRPGVEVHREV